MAVKIEVQTTANTKLLKDFDRIAKTPPQFVKVGYIENVKMNRRKTVVTNAMVAHVQEHGSKNIPPRPFLLPALKSQAKEAEARIRRGLAREWIEPGSTAIGLGQAGTLIRARAKKNIVDSVGMQPLAQATLKARERIGFEGTKPLVHTAQLLNAITYVVK